LNLSFSETWRILPRACQASLQWPMVLFLLGTLCPDLGAYSTAVAAAEYGQQPQHAAELLSQIERLGLAAHSQQKVSCTTEADVEVSSS